MTDQQTAAEQLDGLVGRIVATDAKDQEQVVRLGVALEEILSSDPELPEEIGEALGQGLAALQVLYEGPPVNPCDIMQAIAALLSAAVDGLNDPEPEADLAQAVDRLTDLLEDAPGDRVAEEPSEDPHVKGESEDALASRKTESQDSPPDAPSADPDEDASTSAETAPTRLPEDADGDLLQEFSQESLDHISNAEAALLELESDPGDEGSIHTIFRAFHTIKGTSGFLGLDALQKLAHLAENLLDRARDGEIRISGGYADLALNSCDALRAIIESLDGLEPGQILPLPEKYQDLIEQLTDPEAAGVHDQSDTEPLRTGDLLVARGKAEREQVEQVAADETPGRIGEKLVRSRTAAPRDVADALRTQKAQQGAGRDSTVRVGTHRLDGLIDAVGELVIAQSMVAQDPAVTAGQNPNLARNVAHAGKIVRELQDVSMSLRMVPLKATFGKMARLARDLARKAGKQVRFESEGEETEIDRSMVEVLNDPLVHMMRNALDHGIESPEQRAEAGKDPAGLVRLRAYHSAGNVVIELCDDGKGLDRDRIIAKAVDRGLVQSGENLSDSEAFGLIFRPGFSTAEKITDVSGRGVGMDVVKSGIESLRGRVEVTSELGKGSTFTMRLPLTMAITDAMLLRVGDQRYLLPIPSIERSFQPQPQMLSTVAGRGELVQVRGELLNVLRLYDIFDVPDAETDPSRALMIIVEGEEKRYALMVDDLLGQHQVVIKSLGQKLGHIQGVSGGAILGDGRVGLILDAAELFTSAGAPKAAA